MPDAAASEASQAETDEQAQAATSDSQAEGGAEDSISLDEARKLRSEANSLRKRLKDAETRAAAYDAEKLTVEERLTKQVQALEAEREEWQRQQRTQEVRTAAQAAAVKAGAIDPLVVARLVEADTDDVPAAVRALKAEHPRLFGAPNGSADGGAGGRQDHGADMNTLIRQAAGRG